PLPLRLLFSSLRTPPRSSLFPYTTLFRSVRGHALVLRLALGLLAHVDLRHGGLGAGELHLAADRPAALRGCGGLARPRREGQHQHRTRRCHSSKLPHPTSSMRVLHAVALARERASGRPIVTRRCAAAYHTFL